MANIWYVVSSQVYEYRWCLHSPGGGYTLYTTQRDAWERAKALARKARGVAILMGRNDKERKKVSYELVRSSTAATPTKR